jgi:hypothetical protein
MLSPKVILAALVPFPDGTPVVTAPIVKSPPMVTLEYLAVIFRVALAAKVPPLIVNGPPFPMAFTPPIMIVPAFSVNPPVYALPFDEKNMPLPFLMNPVPAALDILWAAKSSIEPVPTSKVRTAPFVLYVPAAVIVTVEPFVTLMFPTAVLVT